MTDIIIVENKEFVTANLPEPELISAGSQGPAGSFPPTAGTGLVAVDGVGGYVARTLVSLTAALAITNANGVAGNPTFDLNADLKAVAAIGTMGYVKRTAPSTWATSATVPWADLANVPTTLAGYGITDAYTKTQSDANYPLIGGTYANPAWITSLPWSKITSTPTTLAGYGVQADADARYLGISAQAADSAKLLGATWAAPGAIGSTTPSTGAFTTLSATGQFTEADGTALAPAYSFANALSQGFFRGATNHRTVYAHGGSSFLAFGGGLHVGSAAVIAFASQADPDGAFDATLLRDAANTLAQRNGVNAQAFRLYNSFTDAANYERLNIQWSANIADISVQSAGTGVARALQLGTQQSATLTFYTNNSLRWLISAAGNFLASNDNANDIGTGGASRPRHVYIGSSIQLLAASAATNVLVNVNGTHPATTVDTYGIGVQFTSPATSTTLQYGIFTNLKTTAAVYTVANMAHFQADSATLGAGSTVTNVRGFYVKNAIAIGTNNYGFYSDIASATNTWGFYGAGTAWNYLSGYVTIGGSPPSDDSIMLKLGNGSSHRNTSTGLGGVYVIYTTPSTATAASIGYQSNIGTAAASFTLTELTHFKATSSGAGAGSTITNVRGFYAANAIAAGTNNYGFYSDIASATSTYQLYMSGTAQSRFNGSLGINTDPALTSQALNVQNTGAMNGATAVLIYSAATFLSTNTTAGVGAYFDLKSAAAAYTLTDLVGFKANSMTLGAGSTITNVKGFWAANAIAVGTNNYGFYSDINDATTTYAFYAAGTAASRFTGSVAIGTSPVSNTSEALRIVLPATVSAASVVGINLNFAAPATTTSALSAIFLTGSTAAAAFTLPEYNAFRVNQFTLGAGSTLTALNGFYVNALYTNDVAGTTVRGFYSLLNAGTNATVYQLYMGGSAQSYFASAVGIGLAPTLGTSMLNVRGTTLTAANPVIVGVDATFPSTATGTAWGFKTSTLNTAASAFTLAALVHYGADASVAGSGSTITKVYGFWARANIAVGGTNYGYFSDIANAANTYQLYMSGTAPSLFGGALIEHEVVETYSASITMDATAGNERVITVTNSTAFTINAPTSPATGQYMEVTIRNASGGVMGAITWNTVFKMTAFTNPANGFSRTIIFRYNGTNWVEKGRTAADVPN